MKLDALVFIDTEIELGGKKILDIGAVTGDGREFHSNSPAALAGFLAGCRVVCGHNILNHDLKYLEGEHCISGDAIFVDTLFWSPLLFPQKPYHCLVKDDKLAADELNNPLNDAKKARDLFFDEETAFKSLDTAIQQIYYGLLGSHAAFSGFFCAMGYSGAGRDVAALIRESFSGRICAGAPVEKIAGKYPVELAYALALISIMGVSGEDSITPPWVLQNYPRVINVMHFLRGRRCDSCAYCDEMLDEHKALKRFFQYDSYRTFDGMPLQRDAVRAAVRGASILVVFPTGGGKSLTFQVPALMAGANERGLTVVISPLQSLMKDQTDGLEQKYSITEAVTINGSLDPIERARAFERVENGSASMLYLSPESLRSRSIERLLLKRNIVRFVVDEAHCFSAWGQDFRVDYLYIGDFIRRLQQSKGLAHSIPVSCFTATARPEVIEDIRAYFLANLGLQLDVYRAETARKNLKYHVFVFSEEQEKERLLRQLLEQEDCPAILYVSRTKRAEQLAARLTETGYPAKPYHGKMQAQQRAENQEAFMRGAVRIIVATTAFGMGVDKSDVGMVVHVDISDSLENYVQEAGRAGRDASIQANCYVLFSDADLNKHFILLNQTKLTQGEIQQIWIALKRLTAARPVVSQSALEIARAAGWDDSVGDMETRVRTAVSALEQAHFVQRGQNMPRIFSNSILVKTMAEAREKIDRSARFDDESRKQAIRIMAHLISAKQVAKAQDEEAETRVDYISDRLGIVKENVIRVIRLLREEGVLADAKDLVVFLEKGRRAHRAKAALEIHRQVELFLLDHLCDEERLYNIKEMNEALQQRFQGAAQAQKNHINELRTILNYYAIKRFVKKTPTADANHVKMRLYVQAREIRSGATKRWSLAEFIIGYLHAKPPQAGEDETPAVWFSVLELKEEFNRHLFDEKANADEVEDALYYLLKIGALKIEGGFLVIYNAMQIERLEKNNKAQYKKEHYASLDAHYLSKRQQIHIVGEFANRLAQNYDDAMTYVNDYFTMDYDAFLAKYFKGRKAEIGRNMTPKKYRQVFGELSPAQLDIVEDKQANYIVVAAGPGSGKTKLLTHKLASLYLLEDVKHEQMLMLTFSRAAVTEFKKRLMALIGNAANYIQITTFHSYCFDLLGRVGDIEKSDKIIETTLEKIQAGEVDPARMTKRVLVIDEAQDMDAAEFRLVKALMEKNDGLRVIAVGDDDQNIYEFRGSSSAHFAALLRQPNAKKYELLENFRSKANIVQFANSFASTISQRFKQNAILPVEKGYGEVRLCKLAGRNVAIPVTNAVLRAKLPGPTCVVTWTNEDALNIVGLLRQNGVPARQIQGGGGFSLFNLVEIRDFLNAVDTAGDGYTISDETWRRARRDLEKKYAASENLAGICMLLRDFEQTHNKTKYKTDLRQFINESKPEDMVYGSAETVLVSTIHQTKGREFRNVFVALSECFHPDDAARRAIYVALTRAKENLYVFYNGDCFDAIDSPGITRTTDGTIYPQPPHIRLQLTHKDVALGSFKAHQWAIDTLVSGQELSVQGAFCCLGNKRVAKFSAAFCARLDKLAKKGYLPSKAAAGHIVFWKGENEEEELKIILPTIEFEKRATGPE